MPSPEGFRVATPSAWLGPQEAGLDDRQEVAGNRSQETAHSVFRSFLRSFLCAGSYRLLAYFDYPAEHWKHLRTTNPIESTFATVRLREGVTKGGGSRTAGLVMAFKLLLVAEGHWRHIDGAELVPLVRAGVCFEDGVQIEPQKKRKKAVA